MSECPAAPFQRHQNALPRAAASSTSGHSLVRFPLNLTKWQGRTNKQSCKAARILTSLPTLHPSAHNKQSDSADTGCLYTKLQSFSSPAGRVIEAYRAGLRSDMLTVANQCSAEMRLSARFLVAGQLPVLTYAPLLYANMFDKQQGVYN